MDDGGVIGSSEWIWLKDADARLIVEAPMMREIIEDFITVLTTDPGPLDKQARIDSHIKIANALIDRIKEELI